MKQILASWALLCLVYFVWRYLPFRPKFFVKQFLAAHVFAVIALFCIIIGVLFWQAGTSTKLF